MCKIYNLLQKYNTLLTPAIGGQQHWYQPQAAQARVVWILIRASGHQFESHRSQPFFLLFFFLLFYPFYSPFILSFIIRNYFPNETWYLRPFLYFSPPHEIKMNKAGNSEDPKRQLPLIFTLKEPFIFIQSIRISVHVSINTYSRLCSNFILIRDILHYKNLKTRSMCLVDGKTWTRLQDFEIGRWVFVLRSSNFFLH